MKRKMSLWNTPITNPSPEAQRYAKKVHRRRQEFTQKMEEGKSDSGQTRPEPQQVKKPPFSAPPEEDKKENNLTSEASSEITEEKSNVDKPTEEKVEYVKRPRVLRKNQRRRQSLSIAVSEEEEELLRRGAAEAGMTFSAWARFILFRAMKRKIPQRPPK